MTEAEWLACDEPEQMLDFLNGTVAERKLRLFATACCRRIWDLLIDKRSRIAVQKLEEYADDLANVRLRRDAYNTANPAYIDLHSVEFNANASAACVVVAAAYPIVPPQLRVHGSVSRLLFGNLDGNLCNALQVDGRGIRQMQATIVRELLGNPFRPVAFSPEWRTDTAVALAQQMYDSRDFGAMQILADALQDAGCDSDDILNHCRGPGPHVRGCWVVDLVLGKE
jgi:hypothetical protein